MATNPQPPRWAEVLIERLAPAHFAEEIKGDLYEMFLSDVKRFKNNARARRRYSWRVIGFLAKSFFWKRTHQHQHMIGNYFTMAKRNLLAHRGTTTINVLGLMIGIASALAIISILRFELSFDTFHSDQKSIYRMVRASGVDLSEFRTGIPYSDAAGNERYLLHQENDEAGIPPWRQRRRS